MGEKADFDEAYAELQREEACRSFFEKQLYDDTYWLEIMPRDATKANAMLRLKELLGCDKVVCFGDGVIGSNEDNGVLRWLAINF